MLDKVKNNVTPFFIGGFILYFSLFPNCENLGKTQSLDHPFFDVIFNTIRDLFCQNSVFQFLGVFIGIFLLLIGCRNLIN